MTPEAARPRTGVRRRYVAVPAGTYPPPAPLGACRVVPGAVAEAAAAVLDRDPEFAPLAAVPREFAVAASAVAAPVPSPPLEDETFDVFGAEALPAAEPEPVAEPVLPRARGPRPAAGPLVGILVGTAVGALAGLALSTAMLALYAPQDFAQAILDPVSLWTNVEDWKVLAGALLIALGFAVLGAGQGSQPRSSRA